MARAIDGDELLGIERLLDTDVIRKSKTASWLLDQVLHDIQAMPTIDPESLRPRGTWNISDGIIENVVCSRCGTHFQSYYQDYRYCPRCGAKMDGGEQP